MRQKVNSFNTEKDISCRLCFTIALAAVCYYAGSLLKNGQFANTIDVSVIIGLEIVIILLLAIRLLDAKGRDKLTAITGYILLFIVFSMRASEDFASNYLWAEDGRVLIEDSIYEGFKSIIQSPNGAYWVIPRIISLVCYGICLLFGNIQYYPLLQGVIVKLIATLGIYYFCNKKFRWIIESKTTRLLVSLGVVLAIPQNGNDVMTCDTSLPFILNYTVFLIGLDHLCDKKIKSFSCGEIAFLTLQALSTSAAPFVAMITCLSWARWCFYNRSAGKGLYIETVKASVVILAVVVQVLCALSSSRVSSQIDIVTRVIECFKCFIFFPYWDTYQSMLLTIIAFLGWIALVIFSGIPMRIAIFGVLYSYCLMLFCSMVVNSNEEFILFRYYGSRYSITSHQIIMLLSCISIVNMVSSKRKRNSALALTMLCIYVPLFLTTYKIETRGTNFTEAYDISSGVFNRKGKDAVFIPIGPWNPWRLKIPASVENEKEELSELLTGAIDEIDGKNTGDIANDNSVVSVDGWVSLPAGESVQFIFLKLGDREYLAPYSFFEQLDMTDLFDGDAEKIYKFLFFADRAKLTDIRQGVTISCISDKGAYYERDLSIAR